MVIELNSDSKVWQEVRHALREAGYKVSLQQHLYDDHMSLFLEPRCEPEGGELKQGLIVYDGGKKFLPFCAPHEIEQVRQEEISRG